MFVQSIFYWGKNIGLLPITIGIMGGFLFIWGIIATAQATAGQVIADCKNVRRCSLRRRLGWN